MSFGLSLNADVLFLFSYLLLLDGGSCVSLFAIFGRPLAKHDCSCKTIANSNVL